MKILMLLSRFPYPLEKGDKLRAFHQIKTIAKEHQIYLFCINPTAPTPEQLLQLQPYCQKIECYTPRRRQILANIIFFLFSKKPWQYAFFVFPQARKRIESIAKEWAPDHLFCQLLRTADYTKNIDLPKTLDYQDAFSLALRRRTHRSSFPLNRIFQMETLRVQRAETQALEDFSYCLIISENDKKAIINPYQRPITVVKNGIDTLYFHRDRNEKATYDLLFVGNLAYPPNIEASLFLIQQVVPSLLHRFPHLRLCIAGATPGKSLCQTESPHVHIWANPTDIKSAYLSATVFVAPLFSGAGLQNKVLEALAMQIPCITTSIGNAGIQATDKKEVLIANTAQEICVAIEALLTKSIDPDSLRNNGLRFVHENFSWQQETQKWLHLLDSPSLCTKI